MFASHQERYIVTFNFSFTHLYFVSDDIPFTNSKKCCFFKCCTGIFMVVVVDMVLSLLARPSATSTKGLNDVQRFNFYVENIQSFFPRTVNLWNLIPNQCFPENFYVDLFEMQHLYFTARWGHLWCRRWFNLREHLALIYWFAKIIQIFNDRVMWVYSVKY